MKDKDNKTPKPGSEQYDVEQPQDLNTPKFNSSTGKRKSNELPGVEHLDGAKRQSADEDTVINEVEPNLGNQRSDDEEEREKIITP